VSAESIGQTAFLGVEWPREANATPPGPAGRRKLGQKLAEGGRFGLQGKLKSER